MTMSNRPRVLTEQDAGTMDTLIRRGEQAATVAEQKTQQLQDAAADLEQVKGTIPAAAQSAAALATAQAKATLDAATLNATTAATQATLALATLPKFRSPDTSNPPAPTQAELDANLNGLGGTRLTADGATQPLRWTPHTLAGVWVTMGAPTATAPQVEAARALAAQADTKADSASNLAASSQYADLTALLAAPATPNERRRTTADGNTYHRTGTASGKLIFHGGDGTRWRLGVQNGRVTPDMFGLRGDGSFDNSSRWAEMVESSEGREVIVDLGAGAFLFDSGGHTLDYGISGNGITVIGAGNGVTHLIVTDDAPALDYRASSINISGLRVQYATRRNGAALILREFGSAQIDRVAGYGEMDAVVDVMGGNNGRYNDLRGIGGGRGQGGYMARFYATAQSSCTNHRVAGIFGREWAGGVLAQNDVAPGQDERPSGLVGVEGIELDGGSLEGVYTALKATNGRPNYMPVLLRVANLHVNSRANILDVQGWSQTTATGNTGYLATGDAYPLQAYVLTGGADHTITGNNTHAVDGGTGQANDDEPVILTDVERGNIGINIWDRPPAGGNPVVQLRGSSRGLSVEEQVDNGAGAQVSDTSAGIHRRLPGGVIAAGTTSADVRVNGEFVTVPFGSVSSPAKHGLAPSGVFTAPQAGRYWVSVSLQWYGTSNGSLPQAGETFQALVRKNGGPVAFKVAEQAAAVTGVITMAASDLVDLAAGDTLDVRAYSSADRYLSAGASRLTIERQ